LTSDGAVSHVAEWGVLQLIDVEGTSTCSSRTELHLNCRRKNTTAVSGVVRHTYIDIDRAWSRSCSNRQQRVVRAKKTLSENIERLLLLGFTIVFIQIATVRSRNVAMVTDLWRVPAKIGTPRLQSVRWHSTTVGKITKADGRCLPSKTLYIL